MGSEEKRERTWKGNCSSSKKPRNKKANLSIVSPLFKKLFHSMCFPGQTHLREVKQQRKILLLTDITVDTHQKSWQQTVNHDEDSQEVPAYSHHSKKLHKACKTVQLPKTFPLPKPHRFKNSPWLMLRNSASGARQIWYMVHGTWSMVHLKTFPVPKACRFRNSVCSCSATLRASAQILQDKRIMSQNWKLKSLFLMKSPHGELATRWGVW